MQLTLGVDVACRAAHQASLADGTGRLVWSGRRFRTTVQTSISCGRCCRPTPR
jgi:hypothetical protein